MMTSLYMRLGSEAIKNNKIDHMRWSFKDTNYVSKHWTKSLKDITSFDNNAFSLFGGKLVVFGGDFRQILLII